MGLSDMIKNAAGKYAGRNNRGSAGRGRTGGMNTTGRSGAGAGRGSSGIAGKIRSFLNRR